MSESREFELRSMEACSTVSGREPQRYNICRRQQHVDKITVFVDGFRWRPGLEKNHDGTGGADWESHSGTCLDPHFGD